MGDPKLSYGEKPHSYTDVFSLSGDVSLNSRDANPIRDDSNRLIIKIISSFWYVMKITVYL